MTDKIALPDVPRVKKTGAVKDAKGHLALIMASIDQRGLRNQVGERVCNEAADFLSD